MDEPVENYDKMKAIVISLNDDGMENRSDIIRLLSTLLSTTESVEKRKEILEGEFNIPMTREIEEEVSEMCNLGLAVEKKGIDNTSVLHIKNLMETMKWSAQQAMDALKIPKAEQEKYAKRLSEYKK